MFEGLSEADLAGAIEAMLFVTDAPVSAITMADMLHADPADVLQACSDLRERLLEQDGGIILTEVAGGWRLATSPRYHGLLESYVLSWDTRKLSQAALEVLAIVAYAQPVTRGGIANVRGVNSDSSVNSLLEKGLIREAGQADSPGNPILYATSKAFLERFGLRSTADLPPLEEFAPDDQTRDIIRTRLSAAKGFIPPVRDEHAEAGEDAEALPMQRALSDALSTVSGVVDKIDFDDLEFEE